MRRLAGGIEAGGTKFVCAVGFVGSRQLLARAEFKTTNRPEEVLSQSASWLKQEASIHGRLSALGIASFGPVDLDTDSDRYGFITSTPKQGWMDTNIVGFFRDSLSDTTIAFDTDVNGAALGENRHGAAKDLDDFVYVTMGTGIGAGGMSGGALLHGLVHPEMGHLLLPRIEGDDFSGSCPYHGACWEGLCSGPAIEARTGVPATELPADSPVWDLISRYSAIALTNIIFTLSPKRIIVGGSVRKGGKMGETEFFKKLRGEAVKIVGGYVDTSELKTEGIENFIIPPLLGNDAGIVGALVLAEKALLA